MTATTNLDSTRVTPGRLLYLTEPARAVVEFGMLTSSVPLLAALPRGDGHPVLVLPGLGGGDFSTVGLRTVLRGLGYQAHGWRLGRNVGPTAQAVSGIRDRLKELADRSGTGVSLIGLSLGGNYARQLARRTPKAVRQVITLGSPIALGRKTARRQPGADHRPANRLYDDWSDFPRWPHFAEWARWYTRLQTEAPNLPLEPSHTPLPVPTTSIYSRLDGIVGWRVCLNDPGPRAENIAVAGSHIGLAHHPAVLWAIADRLAQPAGQWSPFHPPLMLRAAYLQPRRQS